MKRLMEALLVKAADIFVIIAVFIAILTILLKLLGVVGP